MDVNEIAFVINARIDVCFYIFVPTFFREASVNNVYYVFQMNDLFAKIVCPDRSPGTYSKQSFKNIKTKGYVIYVFFSNQYNKSSN